MRNRQNQLKTPYDFINNKTERTERIGLRFGFVEKVTVHFQDFKTFYSFFVCTLKYKFNLRF